MKGVYTQLRLNGEPGSMYLGFLRLNAPKPALLLGVGEKYASEVSKSGMKEVPVAYQDGRYVVSLDAAAGTSWLFLR